MQTCKRERSHVRAVIAAGIDEYEQLVCDRRHAERERRGDTLIQDAKASWLRDALMHLRLPRGSHPMFFLLSAEGITHRAYTLQ